MILILIFCALICGCSPKINWLTGGPMLPPTENTINPYNYLAYNGPNRPYVIQFAKCFLKMEEKCYRTKYENNFEYVILIVDRNTEYLDNVLKNKSLVILAIDEKTITYKTSYSNLKKFEQILPFAKKGQVPFVYPSYRIENGMQIIVTGELIVRVSAGSLDLLKTFSNINNLNYRENRWLTEEEAVISINNGSKFADIWEVAEGLSRKNWVKKIVPNTFVEREIR